MRTKTNLKAFADYLRQEEKAPATVNKYLHDVAAFFDYLGEREPTKELALSYKKQLTAKNYAVKSINAAITALNSWFSFCGKAHCRLKAVRCQKQLYQNPEKELSKSEYYRLVEAAKGDMRLCLLLQTICCTGIRVSELRYITVEAVRAGEAVVTLKGKTRRIFLIKALRRKLLHYIKERKLTTGSVFVTKSGMPMDRVQIWRAMKSLSEKAQVASCKVFPHNLRHLFARVFYEMEQDVVRLADILGHSSIETTRIYMMSSGLEHQRRMEKLHLII